MYVLIRYHLRQCVCSTIKLGSFIYNMHNLSVILNLYLLEWHFHKTHDYRYNLDDAGNVTLRVTIYFFLRKGKPRVYLHQQIGELGV